MRAFPVRILPILLLAVVTAIPAAEAKTSGRISGKVTTKSGEALLGAIVTVFKQDQDQDGGTISFTRSDRQGGYSLANLTPGSYFLQVSREGYHPITSSAIKIDPGKTTTLNVILQEFLDFVSGEPDPRNWDLRSVVRSTSDRRLIFRDLPSATPLEQEDPFSRGAILNVTSASGLSSDSLRTVPGFGTDRRRIQLRVHGTGERPRPDDLLGPVDLRIRFLLAGAQHLQLPPQLRPGLKFSFGYGRMTMNGPTMGTIARPVDFFDGDPQLRESGIQTVGIGPGVEQQGPGHDRARIRIRPVPGVLRFDQHLLQPVLPDRRHTRPTAGRSRPPLASRRLSDNNSIVAAGRRGSQPAGTNLYHQDRRPGPCQPVQALGGLDRESTFRHDQCRGRQRTKTA